MSEQLKLYVRRGEIWEQFEIPATEPLADEAPEHPVRGLDLLFGSGRPAASSGEEGPPGPPETP